MAEYCNECGKYVGEYSLTGNAICIECNLKTVNFNKGYMQAYEDIRKEKIGFTVICNLCGRKIILDKDGDTFFEWNTAIHNEDILIGNIDLSNMNEIVCRCGNRIAEE